MLSRSLPAALFGLLLSGAAIAGPHHRGGHGHVEAHSHGGHCDHGRVEVVIAPRVPSTAALVVVNDTGRPLDISIDGRSWATVYGRSETIGLPPGNHRVVAAVDGRMLDAWSDVFHPRSSRTWRVGAPAFGEVVVRNPLPIPVQVTAWNGATQVVGPRGEVMFTGLPVGGMSFQVTRMSGLPLDGFSVNVDPWAVSSARVEAPRLGVVWLESRDGRDLAVYVDGRYSGRLGARSSLALEVDPGRHRVDIVDDGGRYSHTVESMTVDVDRYQEARLDVRGAPPPAPGGRHGQVSVHVSARR